MAESSMGRVSHELSGSTPSDNPSNRSGVEEDLIPKPSASPAQHIDYFNKVIIPPKNTENAIYSQNC